MIQDKNNVTLSDDDDGVYLFALRWQGLCTGLSQGMTTTYVADLNQYQQR